MDGDGGGECWLALVLCRMIGTGLRGDEVGECEFLSGVGDDEFVFRLEGELFFRLCIDVDVVVVTVVVVVVVDALPSFVAGAGSSLEPAVDNDVR